MTTSLIAKRIRRRLSKLSVIGLGTMLLLPGSSLGAQRGPVSTPHVLSTTVGGVFNVTPLVPTLTQNAQSGNLCSPGACYVGTATTTANIGWQLQVKLATNPTGFTAAFVQTTAPASAQAVNSGVRTVLNTSTWLTVARGTAPTAGTPIGVMFNANKTNGNQGFVPTGAQLAAVVQYRVIAYP